jgi:hypothetical protein
MWAKEVIMEKEKKRALRRYHDARMQKRAERMILEWWGWEDLTTDELRLQAKRIRDHMCACSCTGCGNPRNGIYTSRRERMTQPERKAEDAYLAAMEDIMTVDPIDIEE